MIEYTREHGFAETSDGPPGMNDGEEFGAWLARIGFEEGATREGLASEEYGVGVRVHRPTGDGPRPWAALVMFEDFERWDPVLVRNDAELLNLRFAMVAFHGVVIARRFDDLVTLLEKAFCAWHEHPSDRVCRQCDPAESRRLDAREQLRAEAKRAEAAKTAGSK